MAHEGCLETMQWYTHMNTPSDLELGKDWEETELLENTNSIGGKSSLYEVKALLYESVLYWCGGF